MIDYGLLGLLLFGAGFLPNLRVPFLPFNLLYLIGGSLLILWFGRRILELRGVELKSAAPYFILPLTLLWSGSYFLSIIPLTYQAITTAILSAAITAAFRALRQRRDANYTLAGKNFLMSLTILTFFLSSSLLLEQYLLFPKFIDLVAVLIGIFSVTWLLLAFMHWILGNLTRQTIFSSLILALISAELTWVMSFWSVNYVPFFLTSRLKDVVAIPLTAAIISVIVIYAGWGIISHRDREKLTRQIIYEYLIVAALAVAFLLLTVRWHPA